MAWTFCQQFLNQNFQFAPHLSHSCPRKGFPKPAVPPLITVFPRPHHVSLSHATGWNPMLGSIECRFSAQPTRHNDIRRIGQLLISGGSGMRVGMGNDQSHLATLAAKMSTSSAMNPGLVFCLIVSPISLVSAASLFHFGAVGPALLFTAVAIYPIAIAGWQLIRGGVPRPLLCRP